MAGQITFTDYIKRSLEALKSASSWIGTILSLILLIIVALVTTFLGVLIAFPIAVGDHPIAAVLTAVIVVIIAIIVTGPFVLSPQYRGIFRGLGGRVEGLIDTSDYSRKVGALFVLSIVHIVISTIVAVVLSLPVIFSAKHLASHLASQFTVINAKSSAALTTSQPRLANLFLLSMLSTGILADLFIILIVITWLQLAYDAVIHLILNRDADARTAVGLYLKAITSKETLKAWLAQLVYNLGFAIILLLVSYTHSVALIGLTEVVLGLIVAILTVAIAIIYAEEELSSH
jgi:hypothetical protein